MQEENREKRIEEPQEVVSWYVRPNDREVVDCYVQPRPMPAGAAPVQPPAAPKKAGKKGLRIFLIAVGVLLTVIVAAIVVSSLTDGETPSIRGDGSTDGEGGDASSIVDIFRTEKTAIPRMQGEADVSMTCTAPSGEKLSIQDVYAKVNPSTVLVVAERGDKASIGTGVILTEDGYIVTNAHVIADGQSVLVALADARQYEAELVGFDSAEDLAVLKAVDAEDLPTAVLGDSDECWVGDTVYAIGNPLGVELRGTLTQGIISAIDRRVTMDGKAMTMLQTTAALNNGNSGGPLINEYGQVIGINTMKMSNSIADAEAATVEGLGFAVPTGRAVTVINDILATGAFHGIPSIGVYVAEEQQPDGTYRPVIDSVTENFGAEAAGLQRGDVILSADGTAVYSNYDLLRARRAHIVGETITLTVQRDGQTLDVEVYLYPVVEE